MVKARGCGSRGFPGVIPRGPWHNNWFDRVHERLRRRDRLASAPLGEGTIYLMRARDVVTAGRAELRDDPLLALKPNCRCAFCEAVRRNHGLAGLGAPNVAARQMCKEQK